MSHIRSRKHTLAAQPLLSQSLFALAAVGLPLAAQAQSPEKTLSEVKVEAKANAEAPYKVEKVSSPKLTQPLLDTTQTITVIKKDVIQEQGASSIVEALRNTPGITLQLGENGNTSAGDTFQMRGFAAQSSIFVDGIRDLGAVTRDAFNVEQVEVAKGPAGADIGRGAASGYVNLVTKLPSREDATSATLGYDSGETKRGTIDLNRRFGDSGAFRINAMVQDGGVMGRKVIQKKSHALAPSIAWGLGGGTRLYLYSQHVRQDNTPDGGTPAVGVPSYYQTDERLRTAPRVDRNNFYGYASDFAKVDADMVTAKIEHELGGKTTLTNTTRYGKTKMDRILTGVHSVTTSKTVKVDGKDVVVPLAQADWSVMRIRQSVLQENEIMGNTTNIVSEFNTGAIGHTLSTGFELLSEEQFAPVRGGLGTAGNANLYQPNRDDALPGYAPALTGAFTKGRTRTAAVYAFDTIKLNAQWQLNGGLRVERYNTETTGATVQAASVPQTIPVGTLVGSRLEKSGKLVSWKAGALYKPAENGSIYLSFANSQTPPGSANFSLAASAGSVANPNMAPQKTSNAELGTKWDVLEKKLALTAAVYRSENKNELTLEDAVSHTWSQLGKRRVEGVELGAVGQITPNWNITAGIATMNSKIIEGTTGGNAAGVATRWTPDLTATLWSTYKLGEQFTFGGGMRYSSEQKRNVDPKTPVIAGTQGIPSYFVADAMFSYKVNKNVSLQFNVYNLFDKFYLESLNSGGSRVVLGARRSGQVSANFTF
ncbi:catecholate siderophore receptor Fiu [Pseudoduganella violacea]|uniref:Catecholate siderophore receptor n=1 Tax=Pseudoduganella violacea TaxID=1715466 RepID=A0A7W5B9F0_9BURK|nr:catecholate siderophore receptor Fiu [Pseudoduganella violacea]MBB3118997.1 catecholate siderophore receptor [Pseudoduganella violacea]